MNRKLVIGIIIAVIVAAVAITTIYVTRSANNIDRQIELGYKYLEDGNYEEAIIAFERAIEIDENNIDAYMGLAEVYVEMDEIDDAIDALEEVIDKDDEEADAYELLVELLVEEGEIDAARTIIEEGLEETDSSKLLDYQEMLSETQNDETISEAESDSQDVFDETEEAVEMVTIPILLGMSQEEAISRLEALNIDYTLYEEQTESYEAGTIISQSEEGSIQEGSSVELVVAAEMTYIVPDLVGRNESEIEGLLGNEIGYTIIEVESETVESGYIISQSIESGNEVSMDDVVEVIVSTGYTPMDEVVFVDAGFEAKVREYYGFGDREIYPEDLSQQTKLHLGSANIENLEDLRWFVNLKELICDWGAPINGNLRSLSELSNLVWIKLNSRSVTGDLSSISGLSNLRYIWLYESSVTGDLSSISGLSNLEDISLYSTSVTGDLSSISGLSNLKIIDLSFTSVTGDLSSISGFDYLYLVDVFNTNVTGTVTLPNGTVVKAE